MRGVIGKIPEWPEAELPRSPDGYGHYVSLGVTFDAEGRCTGAVGNGAYLPHTMPPRPEESQTPPRGRAGGCRGGAEFGS